MILDIMDSPTYFIKDPNSVLDYTIDWTEWMVDEDVIASASWTVPSGIIQDSVSTDISKITIWLSGGTVGQSYPISGKITTSGGRVDERTFIVIVRQR